MADPAAARKQAEEALALVAHRYPNGWGSYDTLSVCTSALRALLAAEPPCDHRYASADVPVGCAPPDASEVYLNPPLRCGTFAAELPPTPAPGPSAPSCSSPPPASRSGRGGGGSDAQRTVRRK